MRKTSLIVSGLLSLSFVAAANAATSVKPTLSDADYWMRMTFSSKVAVPAGYFDLCAGGKSICIQSRSGRFPAASDGAVHYTPDIRDLLMEVNTSVNRSVHYKPDGRRDVWSVALNKGDCEDYAITKKVRLKQAGMPSSALLIVLAVTSWRQPHAVLVVRTDHGDLVLDSLDKRVRQWTPSLYKWVSVQSFSDTWAWYRVGGGTMAKPEPLIAYGESALQMAAAVAANMVPVVNAEDAWDRYWVLRDLVVASVRAFAGAG